MTELSELLVDRDELDKALLAEVLVGYVGIDAKRKEVVPKPAWNGLSSEQKVLVLLLARKAMCALPEVGLAVEACLPKEIEAITGIKGGTLRPKLVEMKKRGLLTQDSAKAYFIPTHAVHEVVGSIRS